MVVDYKTRKSLGEATIGLSLCGLGLWWSWQAYGVGLVSHGETGPGAFPFGVGVLLALGGLGSTMRALWQFYKASGAAEFVVIEGQAVALFGMTVLFGVIFVWASPLLASIFFLTFMIWRIGQRPFFSALMSALLISIILFVVFDVVLGVQLPPDQVINWVRA
jgi:hypothetical protein